MKNNNHTKNKNTINPLVVGVAGATVGAGVAVAATVAMKDAKNRKKVGKVIEMVKDQAIEYMDNLQSPKNMKKGREIIKNAIAKGTKQTHKTGMSSRAQAAH